MSSVGAPFGERPGGAFFQGVPDGSSCCVIWSSEGSVENVAELCGYRLPAHLGTSPMECVFCKTAVKESGRQASSPAEKSDNKSWFDCPRCGKFGITDDALDEIKRLKLRLALVSGWIRQQYDQGMDVVKIRRREVDRLAAMPFPTFKERLERYLLAVAQRSLSLASVYEYREPSLIAIAYCYAPQELDVILRHLKTEGYVDDGPTIPAEGGSGPKGTARLTPKGHMYADELRARHAASSQGFFAMWFSKDLEDARHNGFEVAISRAGYKPHRVDDAQHIEKIDDRIIAEIRRSRFVVADLTGHRGGVYYEGGFVAGLDKPVFYTCRADHADKISLRHSTVQLHHLGHSTGARGEPAGED